MIVRALQHPWTDKTREVWARTPSPAGATFAAKKTKDITTLYLYDQIGVDPFTGEGIDAKRVVEALNAAAGTDLEIHVNSPGGQVFEGLAIYNAIRAFKGKKTVVVDSLAASIASVIALAGDRVVTAHGAMWMVHDPAGGMVVMGTADQIEDESRKLVAALRKARENLVDIYTEQTGSKVAEVSSWMTAETWMTADDALARGLTDEVQKPAPVEEEPAPVPVKTRAEAELPLSVETQHQLVTARVRALTEKFPGMVPGSPRASPERKSP